MSWALKPPIVGLLLLLGMASGPAQVIINEINAAASDRTLQRSLGSYPRVGITTSWLAPSFDDSLWLEGEGPFGFGWANGATIVTELSARMQSRAISLYIRKTFTVSAAEAVAGEMLQLTVNYNDGFIAFINGIEVARRNMGSPGMFAFRDQPAFNVGGGIETINLGAASNYLAAGENIICLQGHNQSLAGGSGWSLALHAELRIAGGATLVPPDGEWRYFPGFAEPSGGLIDYGWLDVLGLDAAATAWAARNFNDATWPTAPGPVGIEGDEPPDYILGVNLYEPAYNVTPSIYTRCLFTVMPEESLSQFPLRLTVDYDDGVIVYLNGREVVRRNVASDGFPAAWDTLAESEHPANGDNDGTVSGQEEIIELLAPRDLLVSGDNVLAVQLHRVSLTSLDAVARVTLESTGPGGRILVQPTDPVSYFVGTEEPFQESVAEDTGPLEEAPDSEADWIELYNAGGETVSLAGWSLTDNADNLRKWMFPTNATIPAGGYLVVVASGLDVGPAQGATYIHSNFKLGAAGEYLGLVNAVGEVGSEFAPAYPPQSYLHSYGRVTNGELGFLELATPGEPNVGPALGSAPDAPAFSPPGGFHPSALQLELTSSPGAEIYYTLDGSDPNPGIIYTNPIPIVTNGVVRARAMHSNSIPTRIVTHTYLIGQSAARQALPALCLSGDPALTFYGPNTVGGPTNGQGIFAIKGGVYVNGDYWVFNNDPMAFNFPKLLGRAAEKPASLEFYPPTGEALRTDFGLRLAGSAWSRDRYQITNAMEQPFDFMALRHKPSFNLFFRTEWGDRPLDYPFFPDSAVTRFESVRIRAGKNDIFNPFIRDELIRRIYRDTGQKSSVGVFNTVYINGVYKGYFNLCERLRQSFMQEHHNSTEAWDVQQINAFTDGDPIHWRKMLFFIRTANLTNLGEYLLVHDYLDVDNFIDYLIVNAYTAMRDWPYNNWVAARERSPQGRWRFYVWDAEGGFGYEGRPVTYNSFTSDLVIPDAMSTWYNYIPALYTLLRVSPEFRLRFADRVQKQLFNGGALVKTNLQARFFELRNAISPIIQEASGQPMSEQFYDIWIAPDTRRTNFFDQLVGQALWPALVAPEFSHYGGLITNGFPLTLTNPNAGGTIYYTTSSADPRAPGGASVGMVYSDPVILAQSTLIKARIRSDSGEWSPVVEAQFLVPELQTEFLPAGSGDWSTDANWSSQPLPYPNGAGAIAIIPPPAAGDRNVNLRAPVTVGEIRFPQATSTNRNRVRDQGTGNTLVFHSTNGPARIEVGGTLAGYVEFEVLAGTTLQSDLQLHVTNIVGHAEHGALRLRANWSGPGGLIKSGLGVTSLTGDAKTYTGATLIEQGVLSVTQPAAPTASSGITVQSGGQLRLTSGSDGGSPRVYAFGGLLNLAGSGRGPEIPDSGGWGKLGALRYDPGGVGNYAVVANPVGLENLSQIHVEGSGNGLTLAGSISGIYPLAKSGGGILELAADSSGYTQLIQVDNGNLAMAGAVSGPIQLASSATLSGYGRVGLVTGVGNLRVNQTVLAAAGTIGVRHQFVFGKIGAPLYAETNAAGNGLLVLPTAPVAPLGLDIYLAGGVVSDAVYRGGIFVPFGTNLAAALAGVPVRVFAADALGGHAYLNQTWTQLMTAQITTVAEAADFGSGPVLGRTIEIRVGGAPATFAAWQAAAFPNPADLANPAVSGPNADPNGSGVPNLLRYALGLGLNDDPATRAPEFAGTPANPGLRFPFDSGRNDIAYVAEATSDVADWSAPTVLFDSREDFPTNWEAGWLTVLDSVPPTTQRYYRLRVMLISTP